MIYNVEKEGCEKLSFSQTGIYNKEFSLNSEDFMKKILLALFITNVFLLPVYSADPVEITAPKEDTVKSLSEADLKTPIKDVTKPQPVAPKVQQVSYKKHYKKAFKPDYQKLGKLIEYGYYEKADAQLNSVMSNNSKDIKAYSLWVVSLAKQCKLEPAQSLLNSLLKKYPNNANLHYAQGIIYYQRTTSSNMKFRSDYNKLINSAYSEFSKANTLDKNDARILNALGVVSLAKGNTKEASEWFKKSYQADKSYSIALDNLGTIDFINAKYADAEKKFNLALTFNSQNTTAMYHLAQVELQKKDFAKALFYLNNALAINENSPAIYNLMGKAYRLQGNEAAAIASFKRSIEVKPEFVLSYYDLAQIYADRGDAEFAIEQLKTSLSVNPDYSDAKLKIADISLSCSKYAQAIVYYSQLTGVDGYNAAALKGLANAYFAQSQNSVQKAFLGSNKDLFQALDCINQAIAINGDDLELHLAKLKLSQLTSQPDMSALELQKIISDKDSSLVSNLVKGEAYISLNDYQNSKRYFDMVVASASAGDYDYLSEILIYDKQYSHAKIIIDKILKTDANNKKALAAAEFIKKSLKYSDDYYLSALGFIKSKNYAAATEYLNKSIALNPVNAQARFLLGKVSEDQKNYEQAATNYKIYLDLAPDSSSAKGLTQKVKMFENRL